MNALWQRPNYRTQQKNWAGFVGIDDTGYDGYKIVSFVGHKYQPRLQLSRCFMHMRISASYTELIQLLLHKDATHT